MTEVRITTRAHAQLTTANGREVCCLCHVKAIDEVDVGQRVFEVSHNTSACVISERADCVTV